MAGLKDSLSIGDFNALDFRSAVQTRVDSIGMYALRIPFKEKSITTDFVVVKTTAAGKIEKGKIIHLEGKATEFGTGIIKRRRFDGNILISSLDRHLVIKSAINNGYIEAFLPSIDQSNEVNSAYTTPDPYVELPEVIIVSTYPSGGGIDWSTYISLAGLYDDGYSAGYYSSYTGGGGGGGGSTSSGGGSTTGTGGSEPYPIPQDQVIKVDVELQDTDPAIDIAKYMKCFSNIPDAGATATIEIFVDIPVNSDPGKIFNWDLGSPGHSFIQLKKQNGGQSVMQNIGFYPVNGFKTVLRPEPVAGKFVNNNGHEYNASYKVNLTAAQLKVAVTTILNLSTFKKYDIDEYNCTDFALEVFNKTVSTTQTLQIPKYFIPGGATPSGTNTPQGLYRTLNKLKILGGPEAANIIVPVVGWVGQGKGPCD